MYLVLNKYSVETVMVALRIKAESVENGNLIREGLAGSNNEVWSGLLRLNEIKTRKEEVTETG